MINERRQYTHCGWNQQYIFGDSDFDLCHRHLTTTLQAKTTTRENYAIVQ